MPRKLPWLTQSASTKNPTKQEGRPVKRPRTSPESDEEFFSGTILESRKGKARTGNEIEDDFPDLSPSAIREAKEKLRPKRAPSSSPPPAEPDLPPPTIELMHKGVDRFDLRDDEWMMVEDEFMQTAKLFTRHLHLAEYQRLKEQLKTQIEVARPVISGAKPSKERHMQMKAEAQFKGQRKALKDGPGSFEKGAIDDYLDSPKRATSRNATPSSFSGVDRSNPITSKSANTYSQPQQKEPASSDSEEDEDLDAPLMTKQATPFIKPDLPLASVRFSSPPRTHASDTTFSNPTSLATGPRIAQTPTTRPSPSSRVRPASRPVRASILFDDDDLPERSEISKGQAERFEKRKADRAKLKETEKKKSIGLDDIPTFMF